MPDKKPAIVGWAQVLATIFLGVVGLIFTFLQNDQQEKNRAVLTNAQLISQREQSEMEFRQRMFEVLVKELLNSNLDVGERVTRLELFQHNFHDLFNGRALFDVLEAEAEKLPKKQGDAIIKDLVSIAKEVTVNQELLVGAIPNTIEMKEGDSLVVKIQAPAKSEDLHEEEAHQEEEHSHKIQIKLIRVQNYAVDIKLRYNIDGIGATPLEFEVSFFDAPLTDNTLLPDKHRFAITLKETNIIVHPHRAKLNVFEFPAHYVTTGYRPSITEVSEMLDGIYP